MQKFRQGDLGETGIAPVSINKDSTFIQIIALLIQLLIFPSLCSSHDVSDMTHLLSRINTQLRFSAFSPVISFTKSNSRPRMN